MPKLMRGTMVGIHKPMTREFEGMGTLDHYLSTNPTNGYERWTVWIGDDELTRDINPNHYTDWLADFRSE